MVFGDVAVAEVTTPDVEAWREAHHTHMHQMERERIERAKRIHAGDEQARKLPVSVERPRSQDGNVGLNRNLEVIRQWLNWAIKKGHRDAENPFTRHGVKVIEFTDEFDRTRRLVPGEEDRLLKAATALDDRWSHVHDLIVAALESGCRRGELLSLLWSDVECDAKTKPLALSLRTGTTKMNDGATHSRESSAGGGPRDAPYPVPRWPTDAAHRVWGRVQDDRRLSGSPKGNHPSPSNAQDILNVIIRP